MCHALSDELDLPIKVPLVDPASPPVFGAVRVQPEEPDVAYRHENLCRLDFGLCQRSCIAVSPEESMPPPCCSCLPSFAPAEQEILRPEKYRNIISAPPISSGFTNVSSQTRSDPEY